MTLTREELERAYVRTQEHRGFVIGKSVDIEVKIGVILNLYFTKEQRQNEFGRKVLDDEYFSFGLKIRILEKINLNLEKKLIEKIGRIKNIRNEFAHKVPGIIPKPGPISISFNIDEEDPTKIEDLYMDFIKLVEEVEPELDKIFNDLIKNENEESLG